LHDRLESKTIIQLSNWFDECWTVRFSFKKSCNCKNKRFEAKLTSLLVHSIAIVVFVYS